MPVPYFVLRAWVFLLGATLIALDLLSTVLGDSSAIPEPGVNGFWAVFSAIARVAAISYLLPFRWGINTPFFHVRVALAAALLIRTGYMSSEMALGVYGAKHWSLWPVLAVLLLSEVAAIGLLFWRRNPIWYYKW